MNTLMTWIIFIFLYSHNLPAGGSHLLPYLIGVMYGHSSYHKKMKIK